MPVDILVDWLEDGYSLQDFEDAYHVGMDNINGVLDYLANSPDKHVVDLTGCPDVEHGADGRPVFKGTNFPVEILFNHLKGGVSPEEFSASYGLDSRQVMSVLECDLALATAT